MSLPTDPKERKNLPVTTGVLDYFPDAIAEIARVSKAGNDQHNPGQPLHWARAASQDHADCIGRHLIERGTIDTADGVRHSGKLAWRALALLQTEIEAERAGMTVEQYNRRLRGEEISLFGATVNVNLRAAGAPDSIEYRGDPDRAADRA